MSAETKDRSRVKREVASDLRALAAKIDGDHPPDAPYCPCCAEDAESLRDLAKRYEREALAVPS